MPGDRLGLEVGDGHRQEGDVDRPVRSRLARASRRSRRPSPGQRDGVERSRTSATRRGAGASRSSSAAGSAASRSNRGQAAEREQGPGGVDVPDAAPRRRHASVIAAENRPVETLAICRTSSIGATVPPAGHHHVHRHRPCIPVPPPIALRSDFRTSDPDRPAHLDAEWPPDDDDHPPPDPAARELFEEMARWPIFDPHSHIDPHRPAARNLDEVLGYHYYTELAHSAGMPADRVAADLAPASACAQPRRVPRPDRQHRPVFLAPGDRPDLPRLRRTTGSPPRTSTTSTTAPTTRPTARPGTARSGTGPGSKPSSSPTTSTTRSKAGTPAKYVPCLRTDDLVLKLHEPRDRRAAPGRDRASTSATTPRSARRSARSSSGSWRRGPGPARSACRPTSPRDRSTPEAGRHADPPGPARDGPPARGARRDPPGRLLDPRRVLRRVQAAVRPDDRPDPRTSTRRASPGAATCSTAGSACTTTATCSTTSPA